MGGWLPLCALYPWSPQLTASVRMIPLGQVTSKFSLSSCGCAPSFAGFCEGWEAVDVLSMPKNLTPLKTTNLLHHFQLLWALAVSEDRPSAMSAPWMLRRV
jgi:hypothetical protein